MLEDERGANSRLGARGPSVARRDDRVPRAVTAITWSLSAGTAPETPMAPRIRPSAKSGTPPLPKTNWYPSRAATLPPKSWRALNRASRSWVLAWKAAAALALARAISGVTQSAPSIRSQATRWPGLVHHGDGHPEADLLRLRQSLAMHSMAVVASRHRRASDVCERVMARPRDVVLPRREPRRTAMAVPRPGKHALARPDVEHPAVPRAGEPRPGELALAQRAALVRADVAAGVDVVSGAGQDDAHAVRFHEHAVCPARLRRARRHGPSRTPRRSHVLLQDVGAMEAAHVLPAHLGGLAHGLDGLGLPLGVGQWRSTIW